MWLTTEIFWLYSGLADSSANASVQPFGGWWGWGSWGCGVGGVLVWGDTLGAQRE